MKASSFKGKGAKAKAPKAAKGEVEPQQPQQYYLDLVRNDPDLAEAMKGHGQELG